MKYKNREKQERASKLDWKSKEIIFMSRTFEIFITRIFITRNANENEFKGILITEYTKVICNMQRIQKRILIICILSTFYLISRVYAQGDWT